MQYGKDTRVQTRNRQNILLSFVIIILILSVGYVGHMDKEDADMRASIINAR